MGTRDSRVDAYIARSPEFARPILSHLRDVVHAACPDAEEAIKWGAPAFMHGGILCGMASFKEHCAFRFWKGSLVVPATATSAVTAMGQFGRLTSVSDLPARKVLASYVKKAMELNDAGVKSPSRSKPRTPRKVVVPAALAAALARNRKARATFDAFSPSQQREYCAWIAEAKREKTRTQRVATAVDWLAEGKPRNWKYMKQ